MFQIGFLEILIILIFGLLIIGPRRLPVVIKTTIKIYKKIENKFNAFKKDIEEDIGADEIILYLIEKITSMLTYLKVIK